MVNNMAMLGCLFGASLCFLNIILLPCFIPSCTIFVDNSMVSSQILMKRARVSFSMHDWLTVKIARVRRTIVLFHVFEKFVSVCFIQVARENILLLVINNMHEKIYRIPQCMQMQLVDVIEHQKSVKEIKKFPLFCRRLQICWSTRPIRDSVLWSCDILVTSKHLFHLT